MIPIDEGLFKKLVGLFPSVQDEELRQLCKKNYNNELAIMGDLTARGYRPVYTPPTSSGRTTYTPVQGRYTPFAYTGLSNTSALLSVTTTSTTTATATTTSSVTTTHPLVTSNGSSCTVTSVKVQGSKALSSVNVNSSTTPGGGSRSNSPFAQYENNSLQRSAHSPIPVKPHPVSHMTKNPGTTSPLSSAPSQSSAVSNSPASVGRCYYPGRFVQGVGFEAGSMGGSPRLTGRPFVPLQGRYTLSGMITEKNSPSVSRTHYVHPVQRDPNYGGHVPPHPPVPIYHGGQPNPVSVPLISHYSSTSTPSYSSSTHPPSSLVHQPAPRTHAPIPSWYGEDDRVMATSSPQAAPRFYNVVHDALVKNKVTDRSSSPPVLIPARTHPVLYGSSPTSYRSSPETTLTPPQHPPYTSYSSTGGTGSSFYATASRLYSQSPKGPIRSELSYGDHYGCGGALPARASPPPYPHYNVPPRSQPAPPGPPAAVTHQQIPPPATAYILPAYRTYSPIQDAYPMRGSPGSHSPKLKLRYLRRIYPGVDETLLLDVLSNADNNVQTAMQELNTMGHVKVDTPPVRPVNATHHGTVTAAAAKFLDTVRPKSTPEKVDKPVAPPRRLTEADKQKTRVRMMEKVKGIPATILNLALESVHYDEEKALILLKKIKDDESQLGSEAKTAVAENDEQHKDGLASHEAGVHDKPSTLSKPPAVPIRRSQKDHSSPCSTAFEQKDTDVSSKSTWTQEDKFFRSRYRTEVKGPNPELRKGPNKDYVKKYNGFIRGPNPENRKGPNTDILLISCPSLDENNEDRRFEDLSITNTISTSSILAKGPNNTYHKGHQSSLIQGSTYKFP